MSGMNYIWKKCELCHQRWTYAIPSEVKYKIDRGVPFEEAWPEASEMAKRAYFSESHLVCLSRVSYHDMGTTAISSY